MNRFCPKKNGCPLFNDRIFIRKSYGEVYKKLYCTAGKERWTQCRRYQVIEKLGQCADFIMPNSRASFEEIEAKLNSIQPL
jgi:hypothetical protein